MSMIPAAAHLEKHFEERKVIFEEVDLALSLAAQMPGDAAEKRKTCEFLKAAIDWIGDDVDSRAKRNALALAVQMPVDREKALATCSISNSIIAVLFGGGAAG